MPFLKSRTCLGELSPGGGEGRPGPERFWVAIQHLLNTHLDPLACTRFLFNIQVTLNQFNQIAFLRTLADLLCAGQGVRDRLLVLEHGAEHQAVEVGKGGDPGHLLGDGDTALCGIALISILLACLPAGDCHEAFAALQVTVSSPTDS